MIRQVVTGSLLLIGLCALTPSTASAHEHFGFGLGIGPSYPVAVAPAPAVERVWVPGHYETRLTNVVVEPERRDREWIPEATRSYRDGYGYVHSVTKPGYYRDVFVPARYETRETRVWVEGYYRDAVIAPPPVVYRRQLVNFGFGFRL